MVRGTLSVNLTSNVPDLGKWQPVLYGSEITFCALFSRSISVIPTKVGRDIARGKRHLAREFDLKQARPWKMAAILRV